MKWKHISIFQTEIFCLASKCKFIETEMYLSVKRNRNLQWKQKLWANMKQECKRGDVCSKS